MLYIVDLAFNVKKKPLFCKCVFILDTIAGHLIYLIICPHIITSLDKYF
jgi:hypothetical protein